MSHEDHDGFLADRAGLARWLAGAAGVGALGTIAGLTAARSVATRRAPVDDPYVNENFETLDGSQTIIGLDVFDIGSRSHSIALRKRLENGVRHAGLNLEQRHNVTKAGTRRYFSALSASA